MSLLCPLALAVLLAAPPHLPPASDGALFEATGGLAYFRGKQGFPDVVHAKDHAYKEFTREVRAGRIDPSRQEFFSYLLTFHPPGSGAVFFHTPWALAEFDKTEHGSSRHLVRRPFAESEVLQYYSLMHSHPTSSREGMGPSRVDVATASRYKNPDGSYRYLYLINNQGRLIQFKARRDIDPGDHGALVRMPVKPRLLVDWIDASS